MSAKKNPAGRISDGAKTEPATFRNPEHTGTPGQEHDYLAEIPGQELGIALASLNDDDPRVREAARAWSIVGPLMGKALSQTQIDEYTRANVNRFQQALGDPPRSIPGYDYPLTDEQRTEFFDHPTTERRAAA